MHSQQLQHCFTWPWMLSILTLRILLFRLFELCFFEFVRLRACLQTSFGMDAREATGPRLAERIITLVISAILL